MNIRDETLIENLLGVFLNVSFPCSTFRPYGYVLPMKFVRKKGFDIEPLILQ